jgi:hypothetical protein
MSQVIVAAADVQDPVQAALDILATHLTNVDASFDAACTDWNDRWASAFTPSNTFFSGNLPTLTSNKPSLNSLYTWSASAQFSLLRTSMKSFKRNYVISEGASNSYDGSSGMGGSGQFIWDISFSSSTLSLMDPYVTKLLLQHIVANAEFSQTPIGVPQAWDGYPAYPNTVGTGQYCFDYIASWIFIQSYVSLTGDVELLTTPITNNHDQQEYTPLDFMRRIANNFMGYPKSEQSPWLVDYGSDKRNFLEAAPTYTNVIAGLQISNAGMMLSLARYLETLDNANHDEEIRELRDNAASIVADAVSYQFQDGGYWACLNASPGNDPVPVRSLADHVYIGQALGIIGDSIDLLPEDVREQMQDLFFSDYLSDTGWVRAISLSDESMANVNCAAEECTDLDKVSMRPDWTAVGAYGGLFGAAVEALGDLEGGFDGMMKALEVGAVVADPKRGTMPGQGIAVMGTNMFMDYLDGNGGMDFPETAFAPNFPEFFDLSEQESGFPADWPSTARSIQNAEGSIVDCFVRSVFGWRPNWDTFVAAASNETEKAAAIDGAIWQRDLARGDFEGVLANVRTPFGNVDLTAGKGGVAWKFSESEPAAVK